jgi:hypothetical protein
MDTDLVVGEGRVHFRHIVLWHVAGYTVSFLACTTSHAGMIAI